MSKRAHKKHKRIPRDLYQTPPPPIEALLPFLAKGTRFKEPCAGELLLAEGLEAAGHFCVAADDIHPLRPSVGTLDARQQPPPPPGTIFITNPPWSRQLLHEIILHLSSLAPTWLLFDADWLHLAGTTPQTRLWGDCYARLRKVVSVGRVKWVFEGSHCAGYENSAWYLFDKPSPAPPEFYGRGQQPAEASRTGRVCYDCRQVIGTTHKWKLAERGGIATTVHRDCGNPRGEPGPPAPMPLFEDRPPAPVEETAGACPNCAALAEPLPSGAYYCCEAMTYRMPGARVCAGQGGGAPVITALSTPGGPVPPQDRRRRGE